MMDIDQLVAGGLIQKTGPAGDMAEKEFREADYDIGRAKEALEGKDYKWSIVKAYYAVFHSAKGIMFLTGYREKSHFAVGEYLGVLSREGKLESRYAQDFKAAMSARQGADYNYDYSKEKAETVVSLAEEFIDRMEELRSKLR
jgi:uncharacterized protein (UPF0332 family)